MNDKCNPAPRATARQDQRGAALVVSLLMLLVMTIIGVSATQSNVLQEKMVHNMADQNRAFQASEAGLLDGAAWVDSLTEANEPVPSTDGSSPVWSLNSFSSPFTAYDFDWMSKAYQFGSKTGESAMSGVARQPYWLVEYEGRLCDDLAAASREGRCRIFYRITSHGTGATSSAAAVLQATMPKRFR